VIDFLASLGINGFIGSQLENILKSTKLFKNIQCEERSTPIGQWGGRLGEIVHILIIIIIIIYFIILLLLTCV
jgi:hypothetical protein